MNILFLKRSFIKKYSNTLYYKNCIKILTDVPSYVENSRCAAWFKVYYRDSNSAKNVLGNYHIYNILFRSNQKISLSLGSSMYYHYTWSLLIVILTYKRSVSLYISVDIHRFAPSSHHESVRMCVVVQAPRYAVYLKWLKYQNIRQKLAVPV